MAVDRYRPPLTVRMIQVIHVSAMRGGSNSLGDPARVVEFYYDPSGELLATYDPVNGTPDAFDSPPLAPRKEPIIPQARPG